MKKTSYLIRFIITLLLLLLAVPWFAEQWLTQQWFGLPIWLLYSMVMTLIISITISVLFSTAWNNAEMKDTEND